MKKLLVFILVVGIIGFGVYYFTDFGKDIVNKITQKDIEVAEVEDVIEESKSETTIVKEEKKDDIKIFSGNDRPIAFMIDNNVNAQPQSSIASAYLVYEIIVEGKETRLMALFKGVDADKVGPIRSSRHYFLNYAKENDAIYAHLGWSPRAEADISTYDINNINGQFYDTGAERTPSSRYWRASERKAPHNAYTNVPSILAISKEKGYRTTSDKKSVLNYVSKEVELNDEDAVVANTITIPYASTHVVKYVYNKDTQKYTRYSKGRIIKDLETGKPLETKNLIVTFAKNYPMPDTESKDRQEVETVGDLDGYYLTNGKAIKIICSKSDRFAQTKYLRLDGTEIEVNDGNTWINICPIDANVVIGE